MRVARIVILAGRRASRAAVASPAHHESAAGSARHHPADMTYRQFCAPGQAKPTNLD